MVPVLKSVAYISMYLENLNMYLEISNKNSKFSQATRGLHYHVISAILIRQKTM